MNLIRPWRIQGEGFLRAIGGVESVDHHQPLIITLATKADEPAWTLSRQSHCFHGPASLPTPPDAGNSGTENAYEDYCRAGGVADPRRPERVLDVRRRLHYYAEI